MKQLTPIIITVLFPLLIFGQKKALNYYLPEIKYNADIPNPEAFFGHQIGEWHLSHDLQQMYMRKLAELSPRITLTEYARSYENRPLLYLTISSEKNMKRIEEIRSRHLQLSDPVGSEKADLENMPVVIYQGFSIHGNEPSGGNAAPLVAYYLAAGNSPDLQKLLDKAVILLDPCYNPDGFNRFANWANVHKNKNLTADSQDREYDEVWPRGRTNHYWFDLNRDWLPVQHPESQGRIDVFHHWKPNVLTDHHEMGTNSTFFFMPGVPQRTNPITPWENQELTGKIGAFHAKALDKIGSLYYSQEGYDDFYYGKGSTYPDANGCIGILFEQASSRGHLQETINGDLSFPFTIRNQVTTALSTQEAALNLRKDLLDYQRRFYHDALKEAAGHEHKAFVFGEKEDQSRLLSFLKILNRHQITVHRLASDTKVGKQSFASDHSFIVSLNQPQYRLIRGIFDKVTSFEDSLFYDVSSWTLPLAFNIEYAGLKAGDFSPKLLGEELSDPEALRNKVLPKMSNYAYLIPWSDYQAPTLVNILQGKGLRAKVATLPLEANGQEFPAGTVMVPAQNQQMDAAELHRLILEAAKQTGVKVQGVSTGLTSTGIDLGSNSFRPLSQPKVLLIVGDGVSSYEAGEVWHLLDQRYGVVVTKGEGRDVGRMDLDKYNTIVMVDGSYNALGKSGSDNIKNWVSSGGTLIAVKRAVQWAKRQGLAQVQFKNGNGNGNANGRRPYNKLRQDNGTNVIGGAIFQAQLDLSHPLAFGFDREHLPVFRRGTLFFKPARNAYATPLMYTSNPLLSGYISEKNLELIKNSAGIIVSGTGQGKVICMADNPNFRAFWYGTNKLFANALFFGNTISSQAVESIQAAPNKQASEEENH